MYIHMYVCMVCFIHLCILQPPLIDICAMSMIKNYVVQVNSSESEIISTETFNETFLYKHLDCYPITTFIVNVTVINSEGLHSNTTMKTVVIQSKFINTSCQDQITLRNGQFTWLVIYYTYDYVCLCIFYIHMKNNKLMYFTI